MMHPAQNLHWQNLAAGRIGIYLLATRPMFFTASVLPVLLGSAWGYAQAGSFNLTAFLLALIAIVCVHASINVLNDVYDDINGTDRANIERIFPYTGGSRFIQENILSREQMFHWGVALGLIGMLPGLVLIKLEGLPVLWLGLAGFGLGILYSAPPVALAGRGLGELAVAVGFGLLPVVGATWLQTHQWDPQTLLLSLPVCVWAGCILLINEFPDRAADEAAGKHTLVVRLGEDTAIRLYVAVNCLALAGIALMAWLGMIQPGALLLPVLFVPLMIKTVINTRNTDLSRDSMTKLIRFTLATHMLGTLWLTAWVLF